MMAIQEIKEQAKNWGKRNHQEKKSLHLFLRCEKKDQGPKNIELFFYRKGPEMCEKARALVKVTGTKKIIKVEKSILDLWLDNFLYFTPECIPGNRISLPDGNCQQEQIKKVERKDAQKAPSIKTVKVLLCRQRLFHP